MEKTNPVKFQQKFGIEVMYFKKLDDLIKIILNNSKERKK